jgi:GTP-binding protein HflX
VEEADLLLHLVDASAPGCPGRIAVVNDVLHKVLGSSLVPTILVLNKADLVDGEELTRLGNSYPGAVRISAATGEGTEGLLAAIGLEMKRGTAVARISVPASDGRTIALVEESGRVSAREVYEDTVVFTARLSRKDIGRLEDAAEVTILSDEDRA